MYAQLEILLLAKNSMYACCVVVTVFQSRIQQRWKGISSPLNSSIEARMNSSYVMSVLMSAQCNC